MQKALSSFDLRFVPRRDTEADRKISELFIVCVLHLVHMNSSPHMGTPRNRKSPLEKYISNRTHHPALLIE